MLADEITSLRSSIHEELDSSENRFTDLMTGINIRFSEITTQLEQLHVQAKSSYNAYAYLKRHLKVPSPKKEPFNPTGSDHF